MKISFIPLWVFWCLLGTSETASARLGEDDLQCMRRYGGASQQRVHAMENKQRPLAHGEFAQTKTYLYEGWKIRIGFMDGVAHRMEYSRTPGKQMTDAQAAAILDANGGSAAWREVPRPRSLNPIDELGNIFASSSARSWERSDGSLAILRSRLILRLESPRAIQQAAEIERARRRSEERIPAF